MELDKHKTKVEFYITTYEAITEDILSNDYEFLKSGKQY